MNDVKNKQDKSFYVFGGLISAVIVAVALLGGIILGQEDIVRLDLSRQVDTNEVSTSAGTDLPKDLDYSGVEDVYDLLRRQYDGDLDEQKLLDGLKEGLTDSTGDPYTEFFNVTDAQQFQDDLTGTFTGIGAELGKENDVVIVVSPLEGFPAETAGLRPKDVIAAIDGEDSTGFSITQAVSKIRGEEGTDVVLTVVRNQSEVLDITITRAVIDAPSVRYEVQDGVGILRVSRFSEDTTDIAKEAADEFKEQGVTKIVLDMRGNPGGFLDQAVSLSGLWLDTDKTIVDVKRGGVTENTLRARGSQQLKGYSTVVLINEGSASASEIVAGALQDHGAATLVGKKSFGKGSVQNLEEIGAGELIKITTARWFTPNGQNIDGEGISPDVEVEMTEEDYSSGNDPQLDRALQLLNGS